MKEQSAIGLVVIIAAAVMTMASQVCKGTKTTNCMVGPVGGKCPYCTAVTSNIPVLVNPPKVVCYALTNYVAGMTMCGEGAQECNWIAGYNCRMCGTYFEVTGKSQDQFIWGDCCMGPQP